MEYARKLLNWLRLKMLSNVALNVDNSYEDMIAWLSLQNTRMCNNYGKLLRCSSKISESSPRCCQYYTYYTRKE